MTQFDIVSIFPAMIEQALRAGVLGRAIDRGVFKVTVSDLRNFTTDRHRTVDDVPYGGGPGMVLKAGPIFGALDAIAERAAARPHVILTSPQGTRFTQATAKRLANEPQLVLLCGRYEGVDERVRLRVDEELSAGDFVLTGGELPALMIVDAVARLIPGVVGDEASVDQESFSRGLLDFPHYTRPAALEWSGAAPDALKVPDVLVSGNHAEIRRWRRRVALARTLARRPELLETAVLDDDERRLLDELRGTREREDE